MKPRRLTGLVAAVAALGVAAFLLPATADWLVTRDGTRIETEGPWKVESRLVVFKRPNGTYASMRLSELDLEASERLTLEMAEAANRPKKTEETPARREPVARLTDKDLPPVGRPEPAEGLADSAYGSEESTGSGSGAPEEAARPVEISTWREVTTTDDPGVAFVGEVRNPTERVAVGVTVTVTLYDSEDEEIASTAATLTGDTLPPGKNGGFRASFPGVFYYARATFDVSAELLLTNRPEEDSAEEPPS